MYYKLTIFFCACLAALSSFSQNGTLRGTVFDAETGEPIFLAQVQLEGTSYGITTDLDGKFSFTAPPGTYTMKVQFLGMAALTVSDVTVIADEITLLGEIQMKSASETLETFEVTAEATRRSETAMLTMKKKSVNVLDGISAQAITQSGDGDAAAAVTRVPGVSISEGKYVFVRGLGDRYTKTTLNGMDIPGLDPDRNSIQIDIFPTNIIDNISGSFNVVRTDDRIDYFFHISAGVGHPFHDFHFFSTVGIIDNYFQHKSVYLGFGQRISSFLLNWVLGCQHKKRALEFKSLSGCCNCPFLHGL